MTAYLPPGSLQVDREADLVRCHVCGRWWKALNVHARYSHDLDADEYRRLAGLKPGTPLTAPSLSARRAQAIRRRMDDDPRVQAGMRVGAELAGTGRLQALARQVARERGGSLERDAQLRADGRALGLRRGEAYRARREARARELGHASLEAYLRERYLDEGALLGDLAVEFGASWSAVRADVARAGILVPRGRRRRNTG